MRSTALTHRLATAADAAALAALMAEAIESLQQPFLTPAQIEASKAIMGIDRQLIADGTYFIVEADGALAGCGGWSFRSTLYGGDATAGRNDQRLHPALDPARIRAMYTAPAHARRGVGRTLLGLCEGAARDAGYLQAELMATLAGEPLYRACGYAAVEHVEDRRGPVPVPLIRMRKALR
jgi:GNAT superfamily N-acetyltransferase